MTPSRRDMANPVRAASRPARGSSRLSRLDRLLRARFSVRRDRVGRREPLRGLDRPDALVSSTERTQRGSAGDERVGDDLDEVVSLRQWQDPVRDDDRLRRHRRSGYQARASWPSSLARVGPSSRSLNRSDASASNASAGSKWKKLSRARPNSAVVLASATRSPTPARSATACCEMAFRQVHSLGDPGRDRRSVREGAACSAGSDVTVKACSHRAMACPWAPRPDRALGTGAEGDPAPGCRGLRVRVLPGRSHRPPGSGRRALRRARPSQAIRRTGRPRGDGPFAPAAPASRRRPRGSGPGRRRIGRARETAGPP